MEVRTDWCYGSVFLLDPDYARIRANLWTVQGMAFSLYAPFYRPPLLPYSEEDIPEVAFFDGLEQNLQLLADASFRPIGMGRGRAYAEQGGIFTFSDLNRMEGDTKRIYLALCSAAANRQGLPLALGGVLLGGVSFA